MILGCFHYENRLPGEISCPGLPPDRSAVEFHAYSDFPLHIVFMCLSVRNAFSIRKMVPMQWKSNRQLRDTHKYVEKLLEPPGLTSARRGCEALSELKNNIFT